MTDSLVANTSVELDEAALHSSREAARSASLSKAQGLELLTRLIGDGAFRARFEAAPAQAFAEIGVTAEQMSRMKESCLTARVLAPAHVLESARQRLQTDIDTSMLALSIPTAKI